MCDDIDTADDFDESVGDIFVRTVVAAGIVHRDNWAIDRRAICWRGGTPHFLGGRDVVNTAVGPPPRGVAGARTARPPRGAFDEPRYPRSVSEGIKLIGVS